MGLDQSREKLYCVWDHVQDFKGKADSFITFLNPHSEYTERI